MAVNMGKAVAYLELDTSKFSKGFKSAQNDLKVFLNNSATATQKMNGLGSALSTVGGMLSKNVSVPLLGVGTASTKVAMDFEAAMSEVKAISGATTTEFKALEEKAIEMGAKTKFSAKESADAFKYMAMAGWDASAMMEGISGIMDLAAASGEDLALTSDIVTDALTAFGLQASDSAHFADVLAQASSKSNTNVALMGETFKYVAPVAGALGYSVEDVSVAIGLMANSGIKGSQAGTALRATMTRLAKPTDAVAIAMEKYNISITDAEGNMKPLSTLLVEMRDRFSGLTEAEKASLAATLAGQEGMSGLLAIVNASGTDFENLTKQINNADGASEQMAKTMMDNTKGSLEQFSGAAESAGIIIGKKLMPEIREVLDTGTELIEKFNSMSDAEQENILKMAKLAVTIPLATKASGVFIKTIAKGGKSLIDFNTEASLLVQAIGLHKKGFDDAALSTGKWYKSITVLGGGLKSFLLNPVGLATTAVVGLSAAFIAGKAQVQEHMQEIAGLSEAEQMLHDNIQENIDAYTSMAKQRQDVITSANEEAYANEVLWEKLQSVVDQNGKVLAGKEAYAEFIRGKLSESVGIEIEIVDGQITKYDELQQSIEKVIEAQKAKAIQEGLSEQYTEAVKNQVNATIDYNNQLQAVAETEAKLKEAEEKLRKATEENKKNTYSATGAVNQYSAEMGEAATEVQALKNKLSDQTKKMNEAQDAMVGYNQTIENYEGLSSAIIEGDADKINNALLKVQEGFLTAETGTRESLEKQAETIKQNYENMTVALEQGAEGVTQEMVDNLKSLSDEANAQLNAKIEQDKQTLITKFNEVGIQAPESLITALMQKDPEIQQSVLNVLTNMKNGVIMNQEDVKTIFGQLGIDAPQSLITKMVELEPSVQKQAINLLAQLQYGEQSKRGEVLQQLRDLGIKIDDNLASGIESNTGTVKTKAGTLGTLGNSEFITFFNKEKAEAKIKEETNASSVGEKARKDFSSWFKNPVTAIVDFVTGGGKKNRDGSHANGLSYVPYNGYMAELHEGERVLTKQQNREYNKGITNGGGDTYNFYNTQPNPYEYAKQMKRAKKELLYGF